MNLTNKTILITGASSGIGKAFAEELGRRKNNIIITARTENLLIETSKNIKQNGSQCLHFPIDGLDEIGAKNVIEKAVQTYGRIDVALFNIGAGPSFNMSKVSATEVKQNMQVYYDTMVNYLIPTIEQMKSQGDGIIAQTNSLAGFLGLPMQGPYSAAKAAGRILLDTCRIELSEFNIRIVTLYPGFVATKNNEDDGIPAPFEISETQAAKHIIKGIEKEKKDYLFPWKLKYLTKLAGILPKTVVGKLLKKSIPKNY